MATLPNVDEVIYAILNVLKTKHLHVGEAFRNMHIFDLSRKYRGAEIEDALNEMLNRGWIVKGSNAGWFNLTDKQPVIKSAHPEEVILAILGAVARLRIRSGEVFRLISLQNLQPRFTSDEINNALASMLNDGLLEQGSLGWLRLTDEGFARL